MSTMKGNFAFALGLAIGFPLVANAQQHERMVEREEEQKTKSHMWLGVVVVVAAVFAIAFLLKTFGID